MTSLIGEKTQFVKINEKKKNLKKKKEKDKSKQQYSV